MKKTILVFLSSCGLMACATFQQENWTGQSFDDYIMRNGIPTSQYALQNGNTVYSFVKPCAYTQTQEEIVVTVDPYHVINSVSRANSCPSSSSTSQYDEYEDFAYNDLLRQQEMDRRIDLLRQQEMTRRIEYLEEAVEGAEIDISLRKALIQSAQIDIRLANGKSDADERREKAEKQIKEEEERLARDERNKAEWEREINQLKSRLYR